MTTVLSVLLAAAVLLAGCGRKPGASEDRSASLPAARVRVQTVESQSRLVTEEVVGTVRARLQATIEPKLSGRLDELPVVLGQRVKAGELVARLDAGEIRARLDQARASLDEAQRDWKRVSALFEQQAATRAEFDAAQARYRVAKGAAAEAKAMLGYAEIRAPFDGVVTRKWANAGDFAMPGKPLMAIEDPAAMQLEADVPEAIAAQVQQNARMAVRADGVSGELAGTVAEIAPAADPATRTVRVKVDLSAQPSLGSGAFVRLLVPVGRTDSPRVPASAVVQRGQLEIVFVVANQRAQLHLVTTGQRVGDEIEILSGIHAGDAVVTDGAAQLTDGQPVEAK
jgi:RND family efflux transporter MFP subunit